MNIQDIISKFLAGTAGAEELQYLEEWRKQSQENLEELKAMQEIMHASDGLLAYKEYNVDKAWDSVLSRSLETPSMEATVRPLYTRWWLAAAVGLFLVATVGMMMWNKEAFPTHFAANDQIEAYSLPDGSTVMLDLASTADIQESFSEEPIVSIAGKAHFKVQKQSEGKTFKVQLSKGHIEVVGTEFTITDLSDQLEVAVNEGHVVYVLGNRRIDLYPGDKISVIDRDVLKTSGQIKNFNSWVFDRIIFKGASLQEAISDLENHFKVSFSVGDNLSYSTCQISGTYEKQSLTSILDEWSALLNLKYEIDGNRVIISDLKCT